MSLRTALFLVCDMLLARIAEADVVCRRRNSLREKKIVVDFWPALGKDARFPPWPDGGHRPPIAE